MYCLHCFHPAMAFEKILSILNLLLFSLIRVSNSENPVSTDFEKVQRVRDSNFRHDAEDYSTDQLSSQYISPDILSNFHANIRNKFSILDLRPKDGCPSRSNGQAGNMFYCPTPNPYNLLEWKCVMTDELCNGIPECPGAEDEDPNLCLFWLAGQEQLRQLRKIIVKQLEKAIDPFGFNTFENHDRSDNAPKFTFPYRVNRPYPQ